MAVCFKVGCCENSLSSDLKRGQRAICRNGKHVFFLEKSGPGDYKYVFFNRDKGLKSYTVNGLYDIVHSEWDIVKIEDINDYNYSIDLRNVSPGQKLQTRNKGIAFYLKKEDDLNNGLFYIITLDTEIVKIQYNGKHCLDSNYDIVSILDENTTTTISNIPKYLNHELTINSLRELIETQKAIIEKLKIETPI